MSKIIDCKGIDCPAPVINTKKYFDSIENGSATVIVDNEIAKNNIIKFANGNNFESLCKENGDLYEIHITKGTVIEKEEVKNTDETKDYTLVIATDKFGSGEDKLGKTLMKSYLYALSESDDLPKDIFFLNAGITLVTENNDTVESLKILQSKGCNIASCGVCLEFYNLKDKLQVGEITNMYNIVEKMNKSEKTVKL